MPKRQVCKDIQKQFLSVQIDHPFPMMIIQLTKSLASLPVCQQDLINALSKASKNFASRSRISGKVLPFSSSPATLVEKLEKSFEVESLPILLNFSL